MNLLAPAGLLGLLLLPIVLAIHLWRIRHRRYEVSSTLLWSQVLRHQPLRRPRHLPSRYVLLLLQLAALAAGALALSRPSWVAAGAHRHLVVAVDTSLAMSATDVRPNRLDRARAEVQALIDGLQPGDAMTLVDAGTEPRYLVTSDDKGVLHAALAGLRQGYGPSGLPGLGPLLSGVVRSEIPAGRQRGSVYLFVPYATQRATLAALAAAAPGLQVRPVGTNGDDRGISGLSISCLQTSCEAYARLVNTAPRAVTTRITVSVDGTRQAPQAITLGPNSSVPMGLTLPHDVRSVELRLDGHDPLPADDAAWAVAPLPVSRTVLLVTNDPSSPLEQALHATPNLHLIVTTADAYADVMTRKVDLTIADATGPDIQPPGNVFYVDPSGSTALFTLQGTQVAPSVSPESPSSGSFDSAALSAGEMPRAGDLLAGVDLSSLVVSSASGASLPSWAHADIEGDSGPLLFSGITDGRRVAVLLFDPRTTSSTNASNLDTLLAFPTLLRNALQVLAPPIPLSAPAGAVVPIAVARQATAWIEPVVGSGGATSLDSSGDMAALPPLRPGLYAVGGGAGDAAQQIAANAQAPGEASLPSNQQPAPAPSAPVVLAPGAITPWEGWAVAALLALLILSGEWWYYVRRT